jgi:hypothetical protein
MNLTLNKNYWRNKMTIKTFFIIALIFIYVLVITILAGIWIYDKIHLWGLPFLPIFCFVDSVILSFFGQTITENNTIGVKKCKR